MHGYKGTDDCSKVRNLNSRIKNTKIDTITDTILSSAYYRGNFYGCITLYKEFINQSDGQPELKVTAVKSSVGNGGGKGSYGKSTK